jgi:hypothetical protein
VASVNVTLYKLDNHDCFQVTANRESIEYARSFADAGLHEGTCSEQGFTVRVPGGDGSSALRIPFVSEPLSYMRMRRPEMDKLSVSAAAFILNPFVINRDFLQKPAAVDPVVKPLSFAVDESYGSAPAKIQNNPNLLGLFGNPRQAEQDPNVKAAASLDSKYVAAGVAKKNGIIQVLSGFPAMVMGAPAAYDEEEAAAYTEFAFAFGENGAVVESWSCGEFCDSTRHLLSKDSKIHFLGPGDTWQSEAYLAKLTKGDCVLAFRGTNVLMNFVADAYVLSKEWPPPHRNSWCPGCRVHSGFADAYEELYPQMEVALEDLKCNAVKITGHSLGGGLATLAAAELRQRKIDVSRLYTFGCPRVGNPAFVKAFTEISLEAGCFPPSWRIVHGNDMVPSMSPTMSGLGGLFHYAHIGKEVHYNRHSSSYKIASDVQDASAKGLDDPTDVSSAPIWKWWNVDHLYYLNRTCWFDKESVLV